MTRYLKYLLVVISMSYSGILKSQDLSMHKWKDRLILVLTSDTSLTIYQDQLKIFKKESAGMKERKLVLYSITPHHYHVGEGNHQWKRSNSLYEKFKLTDSNLEVILIGLDGTTKLRRTDILPTEELFATIDAMPMRQREMKQKKH
jgi:hypothetical protein